MHLITQSKNISAAQTIFHGVDVLLNQDTSDQQANQITAQVKTAQKYLMCYLRDEDIKNQFSPAAETIAAEYQKSSCASVKECAKALSSIADIPEEQAYLHILPALCEALAAKLLNTEDELLQIILERTTFAICGNNIIRNLAPQLLFIGETLGVTPLEFIGKEKCEDLAQIVAKSNDLSFEIALDCVYNVFHKTKVSKLLEFAENHPKSHHTPIIIEQYSSHDTSDYVDNPFYAEKRDRSIFVKGLQKYTLETLVLTKKFLDEHGLRFYLTEGTLLGAVRHHGFIPWDDDVDIAMPREDYDKLVELAKEGKIPPELNFDALENNPKHWVLGAKMQLTRPTPYIQHKVTNLSRCNGPYVDIFPLDYWNRPAGFKNSLANIKVKMCRRLIFIKSGYSKATKKKAARIIARIFLPIMSLPRIQRYAVKNMKKFYNGNRKYSVNLCSYYPYYKEVFLTSFFGEPVYIDFEGEKMPVPCEYDYMLKTVYGKNYDTIPPVAVTTMRKHAFDLKQEN